MGTVLAFERWVLHIIVQDKTTAELTSWIISSSFRWMSSWSSCERALKKSQNTLHEKKIDIPEMKWQNAVQFSLGGSRRAPVCEAVETWIEDRGSRKQEDTHVKGRGGSSRELTYNTEPSCYTQVVNKTPTVKVKQRVSWCFALLSGSMPRIWVPCVAISQGF